MLPFFRGIGTYDLLIKATTASISSGLIAAVRESVSKVTAQGIFATVRGPVEVGVSLTGVVQFMKKISSNEQTNILNAATLNVQDYINSLDIGEELILNEVLERVMSTSDMIKNVGTYGNPFESVHLYIPSKLSDNKTRSTLISDYIPQEDERVIVENVYGGNTPILLRASTT